MRKCFLSSNIFNMFKFSTTQWSVNPSKRAKLLYNLNNFCTGRCSMLSRSSGSPNPSCMGNTPVCWEHTSLWLKNWICRCPMLYWGSISSRFSSNSEVDYSELLENLKEIFPCYKCVMNIKLYKINLTSMSHRLYRVIMNQ